MRILVIKEEACPGCNGEKIKKLRRYACRKCNRYLDKREDAEDARLPERELTCPNPDCNAKAEAAIWEVACTCQGRGVVTTQISLAEALADQEAAILAAIRSTLARLLDVPETIISANGTKAQEAAVHTKLPGTT